MNDLERRYRRLLACYPRDHRERHGEEMLAVLLAGAGDRKRPSRAEVVDLLCGAVRLHLRRAVAADGGIDHRDVLAIVSLLAPVALLAGATTALHELGWWIKAGALSQLLAPAGVPGPLWLRQLPDAPVWGIWLVVAVGAVAGWRRVAVVAAWLGMAGFVLLLTAAPSQHWWLGPDAGWVLLGAVATGGLTWSPGPSRGRALAGRWAIPVMAVAVLGAVAIGTLGYHLREAQLWWLAVLAAVLLLATTGPFFLIGPSAVAAPIFYGLPVAVLLALGALPRRPARHPDPT